MAFTQGYAGHEKHDGAYILSRRPDYLLLGGNVNSNTYESGLQKNCGLLP